MDINLAGLANILPATQIGNGPARNEDDYYAQFDIGWRLPAWAQRLFAAIGAALGGLIIAASAGRVAAIG